jgi:hypothetical protein
VTIATILERLLADPTRSVFRRRRVRVDWRMCASLARLAFGALAIADPSRRTAHH